MTSEDGIVLKDAKQVCRLWMPQSHGDSNKMSVEEIERVQPKEHESAVLVVCGPSGVGKGTLINKLLAECPDQFGFSCSHTTRQPRKGEQVST